jgi:hypothetical protein
MDRLQLGALRRAGHPAASWGEALAGVDYEASLLEAFGADAWVYLEQARRDPTLVGGRGPGTRKTAAATAEAVAAPFVRPYVRFCIAEYTDVMRDSVLRLRTADPCVAEPRAMVASAGVSASRRLNLFLRLGLPHDVVARAWSEMLARRLDVELTLRVLSARKRRANETWPPPRAPSSVCSGASWVHTLERDGTVRIALDRPVLLKGTVGGGKTPWQYELKRRVE